MSTGWDFGAALESLHEGKRVSRTGWNGKSMWLALSPGIEDLASDKFWSPAIRQFGLAHNVATITVCPYIVMYTADGEIVPWAASQTDLLETDWGIAT